MKKQQEKEFDAKFKMYFYNDGNSYRLLFPQMMGKKPTLDDFVNMAKVFAKDEIDLALERQKEEINKVIEKWVEFAGLRKPDRLSVEVSQKYIKELYEQIKEI